ncbi:MAG: OmpH family outer membrane protein [Lewinellaceae bacterium]|nr:OmpH family outer membrane protein [Saprospiraceae bacterium]MCB9338537.1 OmpH family outer membrane protein [Lewinellaceae bacterium]
MKNISLVLNIILLLAVAYLFLDRFSSKKAGQPAETTTEEAAQPLNIVHINLDTLHEKTEKFQQKKAELEKRQDEAESSLTARANAFQKEVMAYQEKLQSGTMTPKSAQEEEARLSKKEQSIMQERERLGNDLLKETDEFNLAFTNEVKGYLDSLKAQMNYDYILVTGAGSPVLVSNAKLDITQQVLDLLNKKK